MYQLTAPLSVGVSAGHSIFDHVERVQNDGTSTHLGPQINWRVSSSLTVGASIGYTVTSFDQSGSIGDTSEFGGVQGLEVRNPSELDEKRIPGAVHVMLGTLVRRLDELPTDKPIVLQCRSGNRSAIAASILQANGIPEVMNLAGGIQAWEKSGLPVV